MEEQKLIEYSGTKTQSKIFKYIQYFLIVFIYFTLLNGFTTPTKTIKEKKCKSSVRFGNSTICLPEIDGMKESYKKPELKSYADSMIGNQNKILGFYLNNSTYNSLKSSNNFQFDDYMILLGPTNLQKHDITTKAEFESLLNGLTNYYDKNSEKINQKALLKLKRLTNIISLGKFVLFEQYSLNSKIKSFVLLTKIQTNDEETVQVGIANVVWIRKKMIFLNYYRTYEGIESIKTTKAKNDYMVLQFYNENN